MEVYILDDLLRRETVVDRYESLIWTERFSSAGDFELVLQSTVENRTAFTPGKWLANNESYRCMKVETVEDTTDDEGRKLLTVKGPSIEIVLDDRVAKSWMTNLTVEPTWTNYGKPGNVARKIFNDICVLGLSSPYDVIPFIADVALFPDDTILEPQDNLVFHIDLKSVYAAIKEDICDLYDLGFRLVRNFDNSQLVFDVYAGCDRTSQQSILPSVIFSPDFENLKNTTELTSNSGAKNVAYVFSPVGFEVVYPQDVPPDVDGFDRQVLVVKAEDITDTDPPTASALMIQRGREALAKSRGYSAFDGEVSQNSQYKYGVDYNLGDLVEMRNTDGIVNSMRVTEQIFVSDSEGERSYPTLSIFKFITPGSWSAWEFNQVWYDLDGNLTLFWENV
jgi:hypothetical protein